MLNYISKRVESFLRQDDGVTAVEYAVMVALIIIVGLASIFTFGDFQRQLWFDTSDKLDAINPNPSN